MAFPVDAARATTNGSTAADPIAVNLPSGIVSGNLLVLILSIDNNTITVPTGWTALKEDVFTGGAHDASVLYRQADGGEGATVSIDTLLSTKFAAITWRITGAADPATQAPEISADALANSATPDPTTVTPTGGAKDYLFLWLGAWEGEQTSPPATGPTNYSNWTGADSGTAAAVASNCRAAGGSRQLNAASEDPPSVTISVADDWLAWALAIHPGVAAASLLLPNRSQSRIVRCR